MKFKRQWHRRRRMRHLSCVQIFAIYTVVSLQQATWSFSDSWSPHGFTCYERFSHQLGTSSFNPVNCGRLTIIALSLDCGGFTSLLRKRKSKTALLLLHDNNESRNSVCAQVLALAEKEHACGGRDNADIPLGYEVGVRTSVVSALPGPPVRVNLVYAHPFEMSQSWLWKISSRSYGKLRSSDRF